MSDVDRAKAFYEGLGWRLDADFPIDEDFRIVQFTPPGSPASIQFGTGLTTMEPGSVKDMYLAVTDIEAARDELIAPRRGRQRGLARREAWAPRDTRPAGTRRAARTAASRRSAIPTATATCSRRSRSGSLGAEGLGRSARRAASASARPARALDELAALLDAIHAPWETAQAAGVSFELYKGGCRP